MILSSFLITPFNLLRSSLLPFYVGFGSFFLVSSSLISWHLNFHLGFFLSLFIVLLGSFVWFSSILSEASAGFHTSNVSSGLSNGVVLFMVSEIMFFFSFFWGFFMNVFYPSSFLGNVFPPLLFSSILVDPSMVPLFNTVILLSSGVSMTWYHHLVILSHSNVSLEKFISLFMTWVLGLLFLGLQVFEFSVCLYSINSSYFGSIFFLLTGFHGFHVLLGLMFITVNLFYSLKNLVSQNHHKAMSFCCWYWHFVDVVWLIVFTFIYN